jgi:hypothetical protein
MRQPLLLLLAFPIAVGSTLFSFEPLRAQTDYVDYVKGEKILEENFDSSGSGWAFEEFSNQDGWLMHTKKNGLALIPFEVDQKRDFEMETYVQLNNGYNPDVIFGDYFALFTLDYPNGLSKPPVSCLFMYNDPRPGFKHMPDPKYHVTELKYFKGDDYYLVTFRKIGGMLYLFVNKEFIAKVPFRSFAKSKAGYWGQVNADYVKINYLEKYVAPAVVPRTEAIATATDPVGTGVKPGGKYYGLIVGVSQYEDPKLRLDKPAVDARKLKEILITNYTFEDANTFLLLNPTRQKLISEFFRLRKVIGPSDNLLIFFAGHGYWDEDAKQGYWWAADGNGDDPSAWLSNSDVREQIRSIKSGHTLLISDACFSGGIFKTRAATIRDASLDMKLLYRMPSRRAITSGTMTTVPDQSAFFEFLSKRLVENQSAFLSSQQLFDSFRATVINNSTAVPQDGVIADTGDEGGDFVFVKRQ